MDTKRTQRSPSDSTSPSSRGPDLKRHNNNASPETMGAVSAPRAPSAIISAAVIKPVPSRPSTTKPKAHAKSSSTSKTKPKSAQRVLPPGFVASGGKWSEDEDKALKQAVETLGARNWKRISEVAFGHKRSDVQCLHRWQKVLKPGLVKGPWTKHEDDVVFKLVTEHGVGNIKWSVIAAQLPGRLGKQARERWYNHLDPTLKKEGWSPEEDAKLMELQAQMGNRWCEIAKLLEGRSENAVKNRWNSARRKRLQAERLAAAAGGKTSTKKSAAKKKGKKKKAPASKPKVKKSTAAKSKNATPRGATTPPGKSMPQNGAGEVPTEKSRKSTSKAKDPRGKTSTAKKSTSGHGDGKKKCSGSRATSKGTKKPKAAKSSTAKTKASKRKTSKTTVNSEVHSPDVGNMDTLSDFSFDMGIETLTMGIASFASSTNDGTGLSPQTAVQYGFSPPGPKEPLYSALGFEPFLKQSPPAGQSKVSPIKHPESISPFGMLAQSGATSQKSPPLFGLGFSNTLDQKSPYFDGMFERMVEDWDLVPESHGAAVSL